MTAGGGGGGGGGIVGRCRVGVPGSGGRDGGLPTRAGGSEERWSREDRRPTRKPATS